MWPHVAFVIDLRISEQNARWCQPGWVGPGPSSEGAKWIPSFLCCLEEERRRVDGQLSGFSCAAAGDEWGDGRRAPGFLPTAPSSLQFSSWPYCRPLSCEGLSARNLLLHGINLVGLVNVRNSHTCSGFCVLVGAKLPVAGGGISGDGDDGPERGSV